MSSLFECDIMPSTRRLLYRFPCIKVLFIILGFLMIAQLFNGFPSVQPRRFHPRLPETDNDEERMMSKRDFQIEDYDAHLSVRQDARLRARQDTRLPVRQASSADEPKNSFYTNRIVHFDLKGAAPKVDYLKQVFRLIKENGATGILIEWEDMFPFNGILEENRCSDAYTVAEVRDLLSTAQTLGLDIIPLVQTFGHLEWILKLDKFRKYRQSDQYAQVICMKDNDGVELVKEAIKQVVQMHKPYGIKYFHIGADEAFEYGRCAKDVAFLSQAGESGLENLAVGHIADIAKYVKSLLEPTAKVLAWHDMLKTYSVATVNQYKLNDIIEPVVWDYSETLQQQNEYTWRELSAAFSNVWGASAFKGANNPSEQLIDINHYLLNNVAWLDQKKEFGPLFQNFRGIILTGWQRYDHFAVLCELLPVSIPSLVVNLQVAVKGLDAHEKSIARAVTKQLKCPYSVSLRHPESFGKCIFPGSSVFEHIQIEWPKMEETIKKEVSDNHQIRGWLNRFNIRHNYTQLWYLKTLSDVINENYEQLVEMEHMIRHSMQQIYKNDTIDEWIYQYFDPTMEKMKGYKSAIKRLQELRVFPKRTFAIRRDLESRTP